MQDDSLSASDLTSGLRRYTLQTLRKLPLPPAKGTVQLHDDAKIDMLFSFC